MKKKQTAALNSRRGENGHSLIEVTIAAAILLVIALGILSTTARALHNNRHGWESTESGNNVRTQFDELMGQSFDSGDLQVPAGETQLLSYDFYTSGVDGDVSDPTSGWWSAADLGTNARSVYRGMNATGKGRVHWLRETRVRQFSIGDLGDPSTAGNKPFQNPSIGFDPADSSSVLSLIHLKEIRVKISKGWAAEAAPDGSAYFDPNHTYTVHLYKAL